MQDEGDRLACSSGIILLLRVDEEEGRTSVMPLHVTEKTARPAMFLACPSARTQPRASPESGARAGRPDRR